ncbi:MAG: class I SAM-dependent methyltransferase [Solirubrobacteraceae bacterium]
MTVSPTVWDQASPHYDRQLWLERAAVRRALRLLALQGHERILDVGTGTGEVLRQLARHPGRREAIGVDLSAAMLARVPDLPAGWSVRVADARRLPFPDGGFDVVMASYLLQVLPEGDVPAVADELCRVLRRGGRLVTITPGIPARGPLRVLGIALDRLAARRPSRYGGLNALDPRPALQRAGFEIVAARWSLRGYLSICVLARRLA